MWDAQQTAVTESAEKREHFDQAFQGQDGAIRAPMQGVLTRKLHSSQLRLACPTVGTATLGEVFNATFNYWAMQQPGNSGLSMPLRQELDIVI